MSAHGSNQGCPLHRLASGRIGQVALCPDCAAVHLSVQCLTLRMDPAAFMELVELMVQARARLLAAESGTACDADEAPNAAESPGALH